MWPHLRGIWPRLLDAASNPARLAVSAGANLLLTAAYLTTAARMRHLAGRREFDFAARFDHDPGAAMP